MAMTDAQAVLLARVLYEGGETLRAAVLARLAEVYEEGWNARNVDDELERTVLDNPYRKD